MFIDKDDINPTSYIKAECISRVTVYNTGKNSKTEIIFEKSMEG